ncbi:thioredoxin fold domain-containing protein [Kaarinaea lacus]
MSKQIVRLFLFILLATGASTSVSAEEKEIALVTQVLQSIMPNANPDSVSESVLPGMYEAVFGPQVIYVSGDGRYIFEGDLYDITTRTNITEGKRRDGRAKVVNALSEDGMVIFRPEKVKHTVTAFTDIDCGYCRKMHKQMDEYNKLGIAFRYLAYPRSGVNTPSYLKALSVWCAKDPREALTFAKGGASLEQIKEIKQVEGRDCKGTVIQHMSAAREVGVTGTPSLILDNGHMIPGYVEPNRLIQMLDQMPNS